MGKIPSGFKNRVGRKAKGRAAARCGNRRKGLPELRIGPIAVSPCRDRELRMLCIPCTGMSIRRMATTPTTAARRRPPSSRSSTYRMWRARRHRPHRAGSLRPESAEADLSPAGSQCRRHRGGRRTLSPPVWGETRAIGADTGETGAIDGQRKLRAGFLLFPRLTQLDFTGPKRKSLRSGNPSGRLVC